MKRTFRTLLIAGGAVLAAPLAASPAWAQAPGQAGDPRPGSRVQAATTAARQQVARYWTADRMRRATPMGHLLSRAPGRSGGAPRLIAPLAFPHAGGAWAGGGAVVRTAGRVFFTYQGRDASCSGNAVTSANGSTVITAGHCVKLDGAWHTNWVFVPGYDNGNRPYGTWTARQTLATAQWAAGEDINHDVGAAVLNTLNGQRLTDVVGAQGIAFNQPRRQNMYAFGYPAASPYDGTRLIYCSGRTFNDFLGSQSMGMGCNMTGGSSGGPWFLGFNEASGTGTLNSVNSFGYVFLPNYMFGPYFGASAQSLYDQAQNA